MAEILVLGAGVIGLGAAITLQQRGHRVTIWTRDDPLATTSAVAAAIWLPFLAEPRDRVLAWSAATFAELQRQTEDPASGVRMTSVTQGFDHEAPDVWWLSAVPGAALLPAHLVPPPFRAAVELEVPLCDTTRYLPWLLARFHAAGGQLVHRTVSDLDEGFAVAPVVVNCTGLGARQLCNDRALEPVRGQVLKLRGVAVNRAWIDDSSGVPCYVLPRLDDIVVGGTAQHADERLAVDPLDSDRILDAACARMPALRQAKVVAAAVGLRPYRTSIRLEAEPRGASHLLIHDYGHGGSGFTLAWGCAAEVAAILDTRLPS